jgi:hypothetical protein
MTELGFMKIQILSFTMLLLITLSANAQNTWKPGCYYDTTGVKHVGLVKVSTLDNETSYGTNETISTDFFKFKINAGAKTQEVYAYDVRSVVANADSFVVQHGYRTDRHGVIKKDTNGTPYRHIIFFQVQLDHTEIKIYSKEQFGTTAMHRTDYYFGKDPDSIQYFSDDNFVKVMCDVMKDAPDIVAKLKNDEFRLGRMNKLLRAYETEKGLPLSKEY